MKWKLLLLCCVLWITGTTQNLISVAAFSIPKPVPANIGDWSSLSALTIVASYTGAASVPTRVEESKVAFTIKSNGNKVCGGSLRDAGFSGRTRIYKAGEISGMLGNCILKPGSYQLCVQFFAADSTGRTVPISSEKCTTTEFVISDPNNPAQGGITYTPPQNTLPADGKKFTEQETKAPITFRWTPITPRPPEGVIYRLKLWQLMQGQNGTTAMKANTPVVEKEVKDVTQAMVSNMPWEVGVPVRNFVWNVQGVGRDGKVITESQATVFTRVEHITQIKKTIILSIVKCKTCSPAWTDDINKMIVIKSDKKILMGDLQENLDNAKSGATITDINAYTVSKKNYIAMSLSDKAGGGTLFIPIIPEGGEENGGNPTCIFNTGDPTCLYCRGCASCYLNNINLPGALQSYSCIGCNACRTFPTVWISDLDPHHQFGFLVADNSGDGTISSPWDGTIKGIFEIKNPDIMISNKKGIDGFISQLNKQPNIKAGIIKDGEKKYLKVVSSSNSFKDTYLSSFFPVDDSGPLNFIIGGHIECEGSCSVGCSFAQGNCHSCATGLTANYSSGGRCQTVTSDTYGHTWLPVYDEMTRVTEESPITTPHHFTTNNINADITNLLKGLVLNDYLVQSTEIIEIDGQKYLLALASDKRKGMVLINKIFVNKDNIQTSKDWMAYLPDAVPEATKNPSSLFIAANDKTRQSNKSDCVCHVTLLR